MDLPGKPWIPPKKSKGLERLRRNAHRRERRCRLKALSPQEKFDREQTLLWWKLHTIFTRKEYITYESLPDRLKAEIAPFTEEFIFPSGIEQEQ